MVKFCLLSVIFLSSCTYFEEFQVSQERFGLPHTAISMPDESYQMLKKESFVNEWVGVRITEAEDEEQESKTGRLRRHGSSARWFPKPSYKVEITHENHTRIYSAQNVDRSYCHYLLANSVFRDAFRHAETDSVIADVHRVFLSINGYDQGIYVSREPIDSAFFARRGLPCISAYALYNGALFSLSSGINTATAFEKIYPKDELAREDLNTLLRILDGGIREDTHKNLEDVLDVDNILRYYAAAVLIDHWDGVRNNLYLWKSADDGRFRLIPWDLDYTFGERMPYEPYIPHRLPLFSNGLFERLLEYPPYNKQFQAYCSEFFNADTLRKRLDVYAEDIRESYQADPYLRSCEANLDDEIAVIEQYIQAVENILSQK